MKDAAGIREPLPRVLVLGGAGFVGRHAVLALLARGVQTVVGSRNPERLECRLPDAARACAKRRARFDELLDADAWQAPLDGVDVVINCVGILRQRGRETYQRVHHLAPAALAEACRQRGIRLLHVSALGLDRGARSRFLHSKLDGEAALKASGADACIVRPSLLHAECGGYGARWIRRVAAWPLHVLPADATGRIAALDVHDLGEALANLATDAMPAELKSASEIELGGSDALPLRDYLAQLRKRSGRGPARVIELPGWLARAASHACDLLHATPFSFGHWELLRRDNVPARNDLPAVLGRPPRLPGLPARPVKAAAPVAEPA